VVSLKGVSSSAGFCTYFWGDRLLKYLGYLLKSFKLDQYSSRVPFECLGFLENMLVGFLELLGSITVEVVIVLVWCFVEICLNGEVFQPCNLQSGVIIQFKCLFILLNFYVVAFSSSINKTKLRILVVFLWVLCFHVPHPI
jgi:hypothetical protein